MDGVSTKKFAANEAYFEIRINEQFLRDKREYWNEYNPLTLVYSEFIYAEGKIRDSDHLKYIPAIADNMLK